MRVDVPARTTVGGVSVGGGSEADARKAVSAHAERLLDRPVRVLGAGRELELTGRALGAAPTGRDDRPSGRHVLAERGARRAHGRAWLRPGAADLGRPAHGLGRRRDQPGRETASWGGPELIFRNDWPAGLLVKIAVTDTSITVRFYSSELGRRVETETGEPYAYVEPAVRTVTNPSLPPGRESIGRRRSIL